MGVTNFDNLPENVAVTRLREARQEAMERKGSAQRVAGGNLRYFRTDNAGTFAWSGQADTESSQSPGTGGAFFTVILTSETAPVFLSDLVVELYTSTNSGSTWVPATSSSLSYRVEPAAPIAVTPYESAYLLSLTAPLNTYLAFKLQALSTDNVGISVVRNG